MRFRRRLRRPCGSSPLTRGKRAVLRLHAVGVRLIPAHAGKTRRFVRNVREYSAHPRSRGENDVRREYLVFVPGSSPLTRGKPAGYPASVQDARLIPAHAGKTMKLQSRRRGTSAHPRSRGENLADKPNVLSHLGSSPLTRGKLARIVYGDYVRGLIPAHAGKTQPCPCRTFRRTAHPRSRGENPAPTTMNAQLCGSSPLTRGKRLFIAARDGVQGLIPAHAGKTLPDMRFYCADRSDLGNP